jgi:hypothetical protein
MPTNYPTSLDNFTNPTANDSLNLPSHSTQHANANDAIEAIEAKLGIGNANQVGLYHINTTTFTSQSSVQVDNVFTSTYTNYLVQINVAGSTPASLEMQTATGGTAQSGSSYEYAGNYTTFTTATVVAVSSLTSKTSNIVGYLNTTQGALNIFVNGPQINNLTTYSSIGTGQGLSSTIQGRMGTAFQSDGIRIFPNAGNITGSLRIYGYRNSTA